MAHSPAQSASPLPAPYQCSVCRKFYVHLFDHVCVLADPSCCHFGEMLVPDESIGTTARHHSHLPSAIRASIPLRS